MKFEFDPKKSISNNEKHGITLKAGVELWNTLSIEINAKNVDEPRFMRIGKINQKFYTCIFTKRGDVIRLISLRRSRKLEETLFYEHA